MTLRLQPDAIRKIADLILVYPEYQSVANIQVFFNSFGAGSKEFVSRPQYTLERLEAINGTEKMEACLLQWLAPYRFKDKIELLDDVIDQVNSFLQYEHLIIQRVGTEIQFMDLPKGTILKPKLTPKKIENQVIKTLAEIEPMVDLLTIDDGMKKVIIQRVVEIAKCLEVKSSMASIILCGSILEGLLSDYANQYREKFMSSQRAPTDKDGRVKPIEDWSIRNLLIVANIQGFIKGDVMNFSHILIDFRNYIHPKEQLSKDFDPDEDTAEMCWSIVKTAIKQLSYYKAA